ncbi:MAG: radical SAM protein [Thiopseudomonas sp.]|nr:radical SAM protein [Thiopseudomonas sp.]MCK9464979.1 radical SAM protein [Thiopseudomonas sp.]
MSKEIIKIGDFTRFNSSSMSINWVITRTCNYTCSYCTVYDNTAPFTPFHQLENAVKQIKSLDKEKYQIIFTGGEPTIYPKFNDLLELILLSIGQNIRINVVTNLSRANSFYKKFVDKFQNFNKNIYFVTSFHFEFANKNSFIQKIKFLINSNYNVTVNLMASPPHMSLVKELMSELKNINSKFLNINPIAIRSGNSLDSRYKKEDLAWLKENFIQEKKPIEVTFSTKENKPIIKNYTASEMNTLRMTNFQDMLCEAGINNFSIDVDGKVNKAVCFRRRDSDFNIYKDDNLKKHLPKTPITCPFSRCNCNDDIHIPKYKNTNSKHSLINIKNLL